MVRALASHQCVVDAICGLNLLLVLSLAPRGFSPTTPVFPSPQKPTLPNSNSIWNARTRLNELIIGSPKITEKIIRENGFEHKKKKSGLNLIPV